jgi:hypothetical protein
MIRYKLGLRHDTRLFEVRSRGTGFCVSATFWLRNAGGMGSIPCENASDLKRKELHKQ